MSGKLVRDAVIGSVLLVGSLLLMNMTFAFPKSSAAFPQMLLAVIILMSVVMVVQSYLKEKNAVRADAQPFNATPYVVYAFILGFVVLFRAAGYFVAAPALLIGMMLYFKMRSWKTMLVVTGVYCAFIYVLFVMQFKLDLI